MKPNKSFVLLFLVCILLFSFFIACGGAGDPGPDPDLDPGSNPGLDPGSDPSHDNPTPKTTYTVIYNANGGGGSMTNSTFTVGVSSALTSNAYTNNGYRFICWNTKANGSGTNYKNSESIKNLAAAGGTITLYAKWSIHEMAWIPDGEFKMGSPPTEPERYGDGTDQEETPHQVTLTKGFYMGIYPVRQDQYFALTNNNPSYFAYPDFPVERVSWFDVVEFCNKLSEYELLDKVYTISGTSVTADFNKNGYRLPTEAEWEYACRAGTTGPFSTGNNITTDQANYDGRAPYNGNPAGAYRETTTAVGSLGYANDWGLYDMHGNVWEWCWDYYGKYKGTPEIDPTGPDTGTRRILRGGSWAYGGKYLRSAYRNFNTMEKQFSEYSFRLVRQEG